MPDCLQRYISASLAAIVGVHPGPAFGDKALQRGHVAKNLLSHPHKQRRRMIEVVCHISKSDNPKVHQAGLLLNVVLQHSEKLSSGLARDPNSPSR